MKTCLYLMGLSLLLVLLTSLPAMAATTTSDQLEALGSNKSVNERVARLESRSRLAVIQSRAVDRHWRLEIGGNYGPVVAGDAYLQTQNLSGEVQLHVSPQFSLGVRYMKAFNNLSQDGQARYENARRAISSNAQYDTTVPAIDYPDQSVMGIINWYMTYGKINLFDLRTVQFDIYSLAGYGQMTLASGDVPTWTAGAGIGFWLSQHLTSRFELRYQNYADRPAGGSSRDLNLIIGTFGLGVLL